MVAQPIQPAPPYITPEEYLRRELESDTKHEYWDGVIVAMAGAKKEHEDIADNIKMSLGNQLRGRHCRAYQAHSVHVPAYNRYVYPDISVVCNPTYTGIVGLDVLVNPLLVVEILSASTADKDRTAKKDGYESVPSISTYVVVFQHRPRVEIYNKQPDGKFAPPVVVVGLEATLTLTSIECELRLADIYDEIEFPVTPEH